MNIPSWAKELIEIAESAIPYAYSPYSKYCVGAAVRTNSGTIYRGCNIENSSFGLSMCAERVAVFSAISAGEKSITALALTSYYSDKHVPITPCGACRQVLTEFSDDPHKTTILWKDEDDRIVISTLADLFPAPFAFKICGD